MLKHETIHQSQRGFTLMEMAVVMVIIGLIVAAVVSGKSVMDGASSMKAYKTFVVPCVAEASKKILYTGDSLGATFVADQPISMGDLSPLVCDIQTGGIVQIHNADEDLKDMMRRHLHNGQDIIVNRSKAMVTLYMPGGA